MVMAHAVWSAWPGGDQAKARRLRRNTIIIAVVAALALGVLLLQAFLHGHLTAIDEYDDGVYFGASIELLHGILPYRDFAFIQPPLITVWLSPFAALSTLTGTAWAMEAARLFVDAISLVNIVLVGALVRRRSSLQVLLTVGIMAFSVGTIESSQTILLEPFVVLLCLLAIHLVADGVGLTGASRRWWWCGVLFGLAGATKVWAIFPCAAVLLVAWPLGPPARRGLLGGASLAFFGATLPFWIGAPFSFFREVVLTQATRSTSGYPLPQRVMDLTGFSGLVALVERHSILATSLVGLVAAAAVAVVGAGIHQAWTSHWPALERVALWSAVLVGIGLLISPTYYYHYAGFMAPFAAILLGMTAAQLYHVALRRSAVRSIFLPALVTWVAVPLFVAGMLVAVIVSVVQAVPAPQVNDPTSDAIPARGCVLYSNPTVALLDNRFTSDVTGCPDVIDVLAQERVLDDGLAGTASDVRDRQLQHAALDWIKSSDAVVLGGTNALGWSHVTHQYLQSHFVRQAGIPKGLNIYVRRVGGAT
jgi:hypothetical protein